MRVEVLEWKGDVFSDEDIHLIGKTCLALANVEYEFSDYVRNVGGNWYQAVSAVIYPNPLRLDFKACTPGTHVVGFFFEPQAELTEALFNGNSFTPEFLERLKQEVAGYRKRMKESSD